MTATPDDPDETARPHPRGSGRDSRRQHRLTALEDADVARALMTRIAALGHDVDPATFGAPGEQPGERWRLAQLLERFTRF